MDPEEEAAERASSGDDEFYDRTTEGRSKNRRAKDAPALDAASLYGRKVSCVAFKSPKSACGCHTCCPVRWAGFCTPCVQVKFCQVRGFRSVGSSPV